MSFEWIHRIKFVLSFSISVSLSVIFGDVCQAIKYHSRKKCMRDQDEDRLYCHNMQCYMAWHTGILAHCVCTTPYTLLDLENVRLENVSALNKMFLLEDIHMYMIVGALIVIKSSLAST